MAKKQPALTLPPIYPIGVDKLEFDPENPRLPLNLRKASSGKIIDWMLNDASLIELIASLGEHGYFSGEPLLAIPSKKHKDHFTVIEGNRRLAATMLLNTPSLASARKTSVSEVVSNAKVIPSELPVAIYGSRDEILEYLGFRHITGVKAWEPIAKARFLEQLYQRETGTQDERCRRLAKIIGTRRDYVLRLLVSLKLVDEMHKDPKLSKLPDSDIDFSFLTTAVTYSNILEFIGLQSTSNLELQGLKKGNFHELCRWMYLRNDEGFARLGDSRNLKSLNKIVAAAKALDAFRAGDSISASLRHTSQPYEALLDSIMDARGNLVAAQESLALLDSTKSEDADKVEEVRRLATDVKTIFQSRLE